MENIEKVRRDMMELWKETFHDSSRYIEIVFGNYFTPENAFTRYHENRLIASLLCVPYKFQILAKDRKKSRVSGMYLCGLATRPEYRRQGIMTQLMDEAEKSIKERGFSFTFLIPADSHLREYYRLKGYRNTSFRRKRTISNSPTTENPPLNIYSIHDLFDKGCLEFVWILAEWCHELEKRDNFHSRILHSRKDMLTVMEENENSIFLTEEAFDLKKPNLAKVVAVAFPEIHEDSKGEDKIKIMGMYVNDREELLNELEKDREEIRKEVEKAISRHYRGRKVVSIEAVDRMQTRGEDEEPYAMIKKFYTNENPIENENITFRISLMLD